MFISQMFKGFFPKQPEVKESKKFFRHFEKDINLKKIVPGQDGEEFFLTMETAVKPPKVDLSFDIRPVAFSQNTAITIEIYPAYIVSNKTNKQLLMLSQPFEKRSFDILKLPFSSFDGKTKVQSYDYKDSTQIDLNSIIPGGVLEMDSKDPKSNK
mmetsp:Transcript_3165/g.4821  ORF Transcript_3165/g.4821 Transcript_3165/m.4821 type:complete len:155 (-) Transcript_3165:3440-3904(-)